ncbi:glycosyltransferase family 39 protein [Patescibacteria group bacterium]
MKILIIISVATILRLISINQSLWLDEGSTALVTQINLGDYFGKFAPGDFHPPLYYLTLKYWSAIGGQSETALRLPSLILGVLSVYVVYLIGKTFDRRTGLLSSLFVATSGLHIYYSQEARMYMMASFFVTLSVYFFVRTFKKHSKINTAAFYTSIIAATLTHYLTLLMIPAFLVYSTWTRNRSSIKISIGSIIAVLAGQILWLPVFTKQFTRGIGVEKSAALWWNILGKTSPKEMALVPVKFVFGRVSVENDLIYGLLSVTVVLFFSIIIVRRYVSIKPFKIYLSSKDKLIWLWFTTPLLISAAIGLFIPVFGYFRLLFVLPAMYLLLARGVTGMKKFQAVTIAFILLINLFSSFYYLAGKKFHREDWRGLENFVKNHSQDNTALVVFPASSQTEAYSYYYIKSLRNTFLCDGCAGPVKYGPKTDIKSNLDQIYYVRYLENIFDPDASTVRYIETQEYNKKSEHRFNGLELWLYENRN